jgi:beta-galactosidase
MDLGWRFHLGDVTPQGPVGHDATYGSVKAGWAGGAAGAKFDDSAWRSLDVPHDWLIEGVFDPSGNVSHGFLQPGVAWYRKSFDLPAEDLGRRLQLDFDGVFRNCKMWVNGHCLGTHASGYTSFGFDISDIVNYGGTNVIAVRVDASDFEGWWYEGAGIYRHVWLTKTSAVHVAKWGTFVSTRLYHETDAISAEVDILTTVLNEGGDYTDCELTSTVLEASGREVATDTDDATLEPGEATEFAQTIIFDNPQLWDVDSPVLYTLRTEVVSEGEVVDVYETPFGIRQFYFDAEQGFVLNGRPLKLKGTCNHQDHAGVGVAVPDRVNEYRIERLREMGSNAYRTAHNPPTPELLDACDRLGMLVMDENRHLSSSPEGLSDLESMILRDRNHPCIILWSMANEEPLQGTDAGARIVTTMNALTRALDPTRPTTTAMNGDWGGAFSLAHDVQGCNYSIQGYDPYHQQHPEHPLLGSETASTVSTRGIYANDPEKGYLSAYDVNRPEWGNLAEDAWQAIADRPFMAGTFVWTGFDYRGEPTPYQWPCISSHFGIMDTCGFPKDNFFYYQAWWSDKTVLHILPHWNWPGREGEEIDVWCHSNCEAVELFLNGESLGSQDMPRNGHLEWKVRYQPGALRAIGYAGGQQIAETTVETTGPAAAIRLTPDRAEIRADGRDCCIVTVSVHDAEGRLVQIADDLVTFHLNGGGILGVGNGDPSSHEPDQANCRRVFNGLCQVIAQAGAAAGELRLTAEAPGLLPTTLVIGAI